MPTTPSTPSKDFVPAEPSPSSTMNDIFVPEVMDEGDAASLFQMQENITGIAAVIARNAPESHPDFDGETCVVCGDPMPAERLALKRVRCTHCQSELEKRKKLMGR